MKLYLACCFVALVSGLTNDECKKAVHTGHGSNDVCMDICDKLLSAGKDLTDPEFLDECLIQHYTAPAYTGRIVADTQCFHQWVYGYSEPDVNTGYAATTVDTPALCQLECQRDDDCWGWLWSSNLVTGNYDRENRCILKTKDLIVGAIDVKFTSATQIVPATYCNVNRAWNCYNGFKCKECDGDYRCVVWSDLHVAGWKYCVEQEVCAPIDPYVPPPTEDSVVEEVVTEIKTTEAPTTKAPTTEAPTTEAPATKAPTTEAPTTKAPTTKVHTTEAPTTKAPTTETPTTKAPTTEAPTTKVQTTEAPTTKVQTTEAPTTKVATTAGPVETEAPTTVDVTTGEPTTEEPITTESQTDEECKDENTTGESDECPKKKHHHCRCHGERGCACSSVLLRVADRPKHLEFSLDN